MTFSIMSENENRFVVSEGLDAGGGEEDSVGEVGKGISLTEQPLIIQATRRHNIGIKI
jgi:hypothetical protein